jgi:hypothetical protein
MMLNAPVPPWFVNEVKVSVAGAMARRGYQRTRRCGGRTNAWIGWRREPGRGLTSSSLRAGERWGSIRPAHRPGPTTPDAGQ